MLVFVALLAALELGARLFFPRDLRAVFNDPGMFVRGRPFVLPHPVRGFALAPGFQNENYRINRAGFRGAELPRDWQNRARVLALGASSTFGWRVRDDESWPAQLQALLQERALVINAAVPSYTSGQARLYLDELLDSVHPSVVLVDAMWNDALFACIDNWMPELLVRQQPAHWRQVLLRRSGLYRALTLKPAEASERPQAKNVKAMAHFRDNLVEMVVRCRKQGVAILLLQPTIQSHLLPEAGMRIGPRTVPRDFFAELLEGFNHELDAVSQQLDVPIVRHPISLGNTLPDSLFLDPAHPTRYGYALVARHVAAKLDSLQLVGDGR